MSNWTMANFATCDGSAFHHHALGGNFPPHPALVAAIPELAADSYLTIDNPPDPPGVLGSDPEWGNFEFNNTGQIIGGVFVADGLFPAAGADFKIRIAHLTLPANEDDDPNKLLAGTLISIAGPEVRTVSFGSCNQPPVAVAGPNQLFHPGDLVMLDGSESFDDNTPSGELLYEWTLVDRPEDSIAELFGAGTATPTFLADQPGTYIASLMVTDGAGVPSAVDTVTIRSFNQSPTAVAGFAKVSGGFVGQLLILDGSRSSDPDDDPLTFAWSIELAPAGAITVFFINPTSLMPSFVPDVEGIYVFRLVVNDGYVDSAPSGTKIAVSQVAGDSCEKKVVESIIIVAKEETPVTTEGNRIALGNFLLQSFEALLEDDFGMAHHKLSKSLERADGCVLRGAPDGNGPGRDWVTGCLQQEFLYERIASVIEEISQ